MNRRYLTGYFFLFFLLGGLPATAQQKNGEVHNVAEELITVDGSSATLACWLERIEREKQLTLAYNASLLDLERVCHIARPGTLTVKALLGELFREYRMKVLPAAGRKLVLQLIPRQTYQLSGTVKEAESGERLYGAVVSLEDGYGNRSFAVTDDNGLFGMEVPEGTYRMRISYMGYTPLQQEQLSIQTDRTLHASLKPMSFEMQGVTVKARRAANELDALVPSNHLAMSSNDLFSQIWILPGVAGVPTQFNFQVDGGNTDENLLLVDGVPVIHAGHINPQLPTFNGDAIKSMTFHKGFFPTRLEGKLSSVTEVKLKEGNLQEHQRTLTLDMPAASATLEGPIIRNKMSYVVSLRRSWLDFFDSLLSEEERLNHASYDYTAKVVYNTNESSSLQLLAYGSRDNYLWPDENGKESTGLRWDNQIYQAAYHTRLGKVESRTAVYYTSHLNRADAGLLGVAEEGYVHNNIRTVNASAEFGIRPDDQYQAHWGARYTHEAYEWTVPEDASRMRREPVHQFSLFYDNDLRIARHLYAQVGVHFVGYLPQKHEHYYSIQPRFSLRYTPSERNLFYLNFSKMEQFYHYLRMDNFSFPTDFRMPSIEGYKPRSSEHYEAGWKHFFGNGRMELSAYYKTRRNVLAFRPEFFMEDYDWNNYIMAGDGNSYGVKLSVQAEWARWTAQASYGYIRSWEWFDDYQSGKRIPSVYDIPHRLNGALSYKLGTRSTITLGGMLSSGRVKDDDGDFGPLPENSFRGSREVMRYRVDAGYTYKRDFGGKLLLLRAGLYNIVGNPPEEEILDFYSVHWHRHCMPYAGVSFKF